MERGDIEQRYRTLRPTFESFGQQLEGVISNLCSHANIQVSQIESRVKSIESVLQKIESKQYSELEDVKDLCGVRVVTFYPDDAERVADHIRGEFLVDGEHSHDKRQKLNIDEFGYRSIHLLISTSESRNNLVEWRPYAGLVAEIQIRSVLQHAWASISHKIDYKSTAQAPEELRRKLFRLSALLELADEEFFSLRNASLSIASAYRAEISRGDFTAALDYESLSQFLAQKLDVQRWVNLGEESGMVVNKWSSVIDSRNKVAILHLLDVAQALDITSLEEFAQAIDVTDNRVRKMLRDFTKRLKRNGGSFRAIAIDILSLILIITRAERLPETFHVSWRRPGIRGTIKEMLQERKS